MEPRTLVLLRTWTVEEDGLDAVGGALGDGWRVHILPPPQASELVPVDADGWVAWHRAALDQLDLTPPVHIGGYSIGGVFALELARALTDKGLELDSVLLLDSELPVPRPRGLVGRARHHVTRLRRMPLARWPVYVRARLHMARRIVPQRARYAFDRTKAKVEGRPAPASFSEFRGLDPITKSALLASLRYVPRRWHGAVALLSSDSWVERALGDPELGWSEYLPNLTRRRLAGDHLTLFTGRHLAENAATINAVLDPAARV